jgi:N6-adenosine-specific RNA methylase IME4
MGVSLLDARPERKVLLDYPTMTGAELFAFGETVNEKAADDCQLFMWATQRFLPLAFKLIEAWGFQYSFTKVWRKVTASDKSHGMQPLDLPQFNCEFVVYARRDRRISSTRRRSLAASTA